MLVNYFLLSSSRKVFYGVGLSISFSPVICAFLYNGLVGFDGWGGLLYFYLTASLLVVFALSTLVYEIIHKIQEPVSYEKFLKFLYFYLAIFLLVSINSFEELGYRIISYPKTAIIIVPVFTAILILLLLTRDKIKERSVSFYNYFIVLTLLLIFWIGYLWFL